VKQERNERLTQKGSYSLTDTVIAEKKEIPVLKEERREKKNEKEICPNLDQHGSLEPPSNAYQYQAYCTSRLFSGGHAAEDPSAAIQHSMSRE
jgi:hypothetical protein